MDQTKTPLYDALCAFQDKNPFSFHVPGHKSGAIFIEDAKKHFSDILSIDLTEVEGLDDLHAPEGIIKEAEDLTAAFFGVAKSYFLVGGSTAGNLAMILATCSRGDHVIVQRNSHKSIMNGLELAGAQPIFIAPEYDEQVGRYTHPAVESVEYALNTYPNVKALILTYPDYFGGTYNLAKIIRLAHEKGIPVLVDEAHGVHFSLGDPFPKSAIDLGADVVVHSAHKMAPAMTMASYLHINSERVSEQKISHYLQAIQSSSPSYPLMASLDIARSYLAKKKEESVEETLQSIEAVRHILSECHCITVLPIQAEMDTLKITIQVKDGFHTNDVVNAFIRLGIYPELNTYNQILFVHGLEPFNQLEELKKAIQTLNERLKITTNHATIEDNGLFLNKIQELALSYEQMVTRTSHEVPLHLSVGKIAGEAIIPYPPGIPLVLKGERITNRHVQLIKSLTERGVDLQQRHEKGYVSVFSQ